MRKKNDWFYIYYEIIQTQKNNKMETANNTPINGPFVYRIYDSMGRRTEIYVIANNIKNACKEAKKKINEIGSAYYKVKREYADGFRKRGNY